MKRQAVIFKYNLDLSNDVQSLRIPGLRPKIRHVAVQNKQITIWAEVDPGDGMLISNFKVVATGEAWTAEAWKYLGTVQMGAYVWHVLQAVKV